MEEDVTKALEGRELGPISCPQLHEDRASDSFCAKAGKCMQGLQALWRVELKLLNPEWEILLESFRAPDEDP